MFTAIDCLDGYMKARLVTLSAGTRARSIHRVDTWHGGRFLERWADPGALSALEKAFAHYDVRDVARALWETIDLFQGLEEETARRLGLEVELDQPRAAAPRCRGRSRPARRIYPVAVKRVTAARRGCAPRGGCGGGDDESTSTDTETTTYTLLTTTVRVYFLRDGKVWPVARDVETPGVGNGCTR